MKLIRTGGADENALIPNEICISTASTSSSNSSSCTSSNTCFVGRFPEPANSIVGSSKQRSQIVIPCLFISSTHFSISVVPDAKSGTKQSVAIIKDHSRNGTYVNGVIIGKEEEKHLKDGDEISLQYRGIVQICYKFVCSAPEDNSDALHDGNDDSILTSPKKSDNFLNDAFMQQLNALKEENSRQELRLQSILEEKDASRKSLDNYTRKNRAQEKIIESMEKEAAEMKERLQTSTVNATSIEARNVILQDSLEEAKGEIRELKSRVTTLSDDLKHKSMQLENRQSLVDKGSKAVAQEKALRQGAEIECKNLASKLKDSLQQNERIVTANETLQDMISELETVLVGTKEENRKLVRILQEVSAADKERDASMGAFRQQCFDAVHKLNSLLQKQEPVSKIESIIGDLSAYGRPPENEETAVAAGTYCSQLKMPRMFGLTARGSRGMLTEEDMVISCTQVFDGEETATAAPPVTLAPPVVAVSVSVSVPTPVSVSVPVPLSQSSRSSRNKSSEAATAAMKSKEDSKKLSQSSQATTKEKRTRTSARQRSRGTVGLSTSSSSSSASNKKTIFPDSDDDDEEEEEDVAEDAVTQPSNKRLKTSTQEGLQLMDKSALSRLPAVKEVVGNENDDSSCVNDSKDRTCLNTTSDLTYLGAGKEAALATDENMNVNNISNTTNVSAQESIFEDGQMQDSFVITDAVLRM